MTSYSGVLKIVRFNWPWYAAAITSTLAVILSLYFGVLRGPVVAFVLIGLIVGIGWLLASLAVSHYVYDRSAISRGAWLDGLDAPKAGRVAVFHAGHDEASETVARRLTSAEVQVFDFYDARRNGTASLKRARALAKQHDVPIEPDRIPLADGMLDLGLVVFAAHEIREDNQRAAFFAELCRVLTPSGRIIVVEHLRDGWNFLAYGPGAFHFLSRRTFRRSFASGGLEVLRESSSTPFVRVFQLRKNS